MSQSRSREGQFGPTVAPAAILARGRIGPPWAPGVPSAGRCPLALFIILLAVELTGPASEIKPWLKAHACRPVGGSFTVQSGDAWKHQSGTYENAKIEMRRQASGRGASHIWIKRKRSVQRTDGTAIHFRVTGRAYSCRQEE